MDTKFEMTIAGIGAVIIVGCLVALGQQANANQQRLHELELENMKLQTHLDILLDAQSNDRVMTVRM
jgi:hypothetical protein